jgi:hypothetical protein
MTPLEPFFYETPQRIFKYCEPSRHVNRNITVPVITGIDLNSAVSDTAIAFTPAVSRHAFYHGILLSFLK